MSKQSPIDTSCTNTGHFSERKFTSPCCYMDLSGSDIDAGWKSATCPECSRRLKLSIEQVPSYICELADEDD